MKFQLFTMAAVLLFASSTFATNVVSQDSVPEEHKLKPDL